MSSFPSYSSTTHAALAKREAEKAQAAAEWSVARDMSRALGVGELPEQPGPMGGNTVKRLKALLQEERERAARFEQVSRDNPPAGRRPLTTAARHF